MTLRRLIGNLKWLWLWLWFFTTVWPETLSRNMYPCVPIIWNVCFRFKICTQSWLANPQYVSKTILSHTKYASSCTCTTNEFSIYRGTLHLLLLQILEWNVVWCFAGSKILSPGSRHGKARSFAQLTASLQHVISRNVRHCYSGFCGRKHYWSDCGLIFSSYPFPVGHSGHFCRALQFFQN